MANTNSMPRKVSQKKDSNSAEQDDNNDYDEKRSEESNSPRYNDRESRATTLT